LTCTGGTAGSGVSGTGTLTAGYGTLLRSGSAGNKTVGGTTYNNNAFAFLSIYGNNATSYSYGRASQWSPDLIFSPGYGGAVQFYVSFAPDDVYGVGNGGACLIQY
jgi:hypothetical protein